MYIVKRLWIDTMENNTSDAFGYKVIGWVSSKEEADRISALSSIPKSKHPWPLKYATDFPGDSVPEFICSSFSAIDGFALDELQLIASAEGY